VPWLGDAGLLPGGVEDVEELLRRSSHLGGGADGDRAGAGAASEKAKLWAKFSSWVDCSKSQTIRLQKKILKQFVMMVVRWKKAMAEKRVEAWLQLKPVTAG
jgi:hypothetical protein